VPRKIRCVTFDCYGTLVDWQAGIENALLAVPVLNGDRELVKTLVARREEIERDLIVGGSELPTEESPEEMFEAPEYRPYREILADSIRTAAGDLGLEIAAEDARRIAASMPAWDPFPDTRDALREIKKMFKIAILSNVEEEVIAETVKKLGVPIDLVITAERVGSYKPAPDHWYAALHELEADEEEIIHLAASPFHDLETATLLGIPCGYINRSGYPIGSEARPLFEVPDLAGAVARLKGDVLRR